MSFWSHSKSSKWANDVANELEKEFPPCSEEALASFSANTDRGSLSTAGLPPPVVQTRSRSARAPHSGRLFDRFKSALGRSRAAPSATQHSDDHRHSHALRQKGLELPTMVDKSASDEVDEVVVDRKWEEEFQQSAVHVVDADEESLADGADGEPNVRRPRQPGPPQGFWASSKALAFFRWRVCPAVGDFFEPRFESPQTETLYKKENWSTSRWLALTACGFFVINWILGVATIPTPLVLADKIFYYAVAPLLTFPLIPLCFFNYPLKHSITYQYYLTACTWGWPFYQVLFTYLCGFWGSDVVKFTCGTKDFLSIFYYTSALQTVALFGMNLRRFPALVGASSFFVVSSVLILPAQPSWFRNTVNYILFQAFLLYMHYQRDIAARRLFHLQTQFKRQLQKVEKAQMNERKAADSKYRLTSYVFHEVRVPLNTALLAVQNMDASNTVTKDMELEFNALQGSLSMMSKVLNDVLDFNRMDSGRFESLSRPYAFHQVMRSMFMPLRLATDARNLTFDAHLDMAIDDVARRAGLEALGLDADTIEKHMRENPSGESHWGMVAGDETRLRQIVTNLASNACKFTPAGGKVTIATKLLFAHTAAAPRPINAVSPFDRDMRTNGHIPNTEERQSLSDCDLKEHNNLASKKITDRVVVRIEVSDTGSGIKPDDMVQGKLFSAFNQTEQGRLQGGKGTGLGLALVRQIVKLSGGRLGVRSRVGHGSTFWVELPLRVGLDTVAPSEDDALEYATMTSSPRLKAILRMSSVARNRDSLKSVQSIVDAAQNGSAVHVLKQAQTQAGGSRLSVRSSSALQGLMDQAGRVELMLPNHDSHAPTPTRTIGEPSTGSEYPRSEPSNTAPDTKRPSGLSRIPGSVSPSPPSIPSPFSPVPSAASPNDTPRPSSVVPRAAQDRPTFIPLPPASAFDVDTGQQPLPSNNSTSSSPVATRSFMLDRGLDVLVVDDDALTRKLMTRMLQRLGCTVTTAENGDMALAILLGGLHTPSSTVATPASTSGTVPILEMDVKPETKFTIVFLDNQMPILSGLEVVRRLREVGRPDFVVGVTGNALLADQNEYLTAGVDYVLTKPVFERHLRTMLSMAEERRSRSTDASP